MQKTLYVREEEMHLWEKIKEMAKEKDRSISYLTHKAIEEYIKKEQ